VKQLEINIPANEKIVNKKVKEEFTLKNATLYGGYNLFSDYLAINGLDRLLEQELMACSKITSQNWRPDLGQICSIQNRKTTGIAGLFRGFYD